MDYKDHLTNLTIEDTCSAQKAVDYLDGYYRPYLIDLLDSEHTGIKEWRKRGVQLVWENYLSLIIEKSAKTYQEQPDRTIVVNDAVNDEATMAYRDILRNSNFRPSVEDLDQLSRLLKTAVILPQYIEETGEFMFSNLSRNNCDIDYDYKTGRVESVMYTAHTCGPRGGRLYHYWDIDNVLDIEVEGDGKDKKITIVGKENNPYDMVPAVLLFDIRRPRYSVWHKPSWEQLTYLNDGLNLYHIETKFNARYGAIGSLFTNLKIAEGTVFGPDAVISAEVQPGEVPFVEFRAPQVEVESFLKWLDNFKDTVADQWGVNLKVAGSGSADSGFKLIVEEAPTLELRMKRLPAARDFERQLYKVVANMANYHQVARLPEDGQLNADFAEPSLPVDKMEAWQIAKEKLALGLMTKREYWKMENPDISDEELDEKELRTRTQATVEPDFTEV